MGTSAKPAAIAPFLAMEVARDAGHMVAAGRDVVRFDVGQPDEGAPETARARVRNAMAHELMGYSEALGLKDLRHALSRWYGKTYNLDMAPARFVITTGASGGFILAFLALFGAGARVAMAAPGYPPYRHILTALGMESVAIESDEGETLQLSPRLIAKAGPIDGVVAASPANPTGAMLTRSDLLGLAEASREKQAAFVCDEIYHGLTYEAPAASALAIDPDAFVINSFSKYWAMTGWRVGWIVAPERLVKPIERLAQNLTIAPPTISQIAALGALEDTHEAEMRRARYGANRALILHTLPDLSLAPIARPDGAFYMLIDISAHAADSLTFCHALLHEAGVALTPGLDFCEARGRAWVRLAYCQPRERVVEGLARLRHFLAR